MRRTLRLAAVVGILLVAGFPPARAQLRKGKAYTTAQKECVECHKAELKDYSGRASRHKPVAEGKCESCHLRHGVVGVMRLSADDPALCLSCHGEIAAGGARGPAPEGAAKARRAYTHPPEAALKCGSCHDPHGAALPRMLRAAPREGCLSCHAAAGFQGKSLHAPGSADCLTCHDPHGSERPAALAKAPEALCVSCHDGKAEAERSGHGGARLEPSTCLSCHAPHASGGEGLLRRAVHPPILADAGGCASCHDMESAKGGAPPLNAAGADLCLSCHDDPRAAGEGPDHRVHAAVADGECLTCHAPHASDIAGLLVAPQVELCGTCHTEAESATAAKAKHAPATETCTSCHAPHAGGGKLLVAAVPALCTGCHDDIPGQTARAHPHPPAAEGECLTCHAPHGSETKGILKETQTALCVTCHDTFGEELAARFRHDPAVKGECSACHEPHGAEAETMLPKDLGGRCLTCHEPLKSETAGLAPHAPFAEGECLSCHVPHSSPREHLLAAEPVLVCGTCHDIGEAGSKTVHVPVKRGQCLTCHTPHAGYGEALLREPNVKTLCLGCHVDTGKTLAQLDANLHPPFRDSTCLTCHTAHVSEADGLLSKPPAQLCTGCHSLQKSSLTQAHRGLLSATTDCASCHEGHASTGPKLLLSDQHDPFRAAECAACHQGGVP